MIYQDRSRIRKNIHTESGYYTIWQRRESQTSFLVTLRNHARAKKTKNKKNHTTKPPAVRSEKCQRVEGLEHELVRGPNRRR